MEIPNPKPKRRDTDRTDRGASMVEFALLAPILVVMLLGTITMGLSFNRLNSLNNGARESARYAATLPGGDDLSGWLNAVADVAGSSSNIGAGTDGQQICVAYVFPDGSETHDQTVAVVETNGTRTLAPGTTCFDDGRPSSERRVQITVERTTNIETGVFSTDITLDARSVARYERA